MRVRTYGGETTDYPIEVGLQGSTLSKQEPLPQMVSVYCFNHRGCMFIINISKKKKREGGFPRWVPILIIDKLKQDIQGFLADEVVLIKQTIKKANSML